MHDHTSFENKTQFDLITQGIKHCGGVNAFAAKMGVTRHTVRRWKICKHMMSQNYYEELTKWIKEEKLIGKKIETDG